MAETVGLIRQTELEELVLRYKQDQKVILTSNLNLDRKDRIARQVFQAYKLLLSLGKVERSMSIKEFEIAQQEVKIETEAELKELKQALSKTWFIWFIRKDRLRDTIDDHETLIECGYDRNTSLYNMAQLRVQLYGYLPENFEDLVAKIFQTRYGDVGVQPQETEGRANGGNA